VYYVLPARYIGTSPIEHLNPCFPRRVLAPVFLIRIMSPIRSSQSAQSRGKMTSFATVHRSSPEQGTKLGIYKRSIRCPISPANHIAFLPPLFKRRFLVHLRMLSKYQEVKDMKVVLLLIDGTQSTNTGRTFPVFSNALQRELFLAESANLTSATAAAEAVSKAFKTWKHTPWSTRRDILLHTADILKHSEDDL
jgi:hypothetical protein